MIITFAGDAGSGKSTVIRLLKEQLPDFEQMQIGDIRRALAKDKGMTIQEFNEWALKHPEEGDIEVDKAAQKKSLAMKNVLISTRVGPIFWPHSLKVYLSVDPMVGALRIFEAKQQSNDRNEDFASTIQEQLELNNKRAENDIQRYQKIYDFNPYSKEGYDLVIDTTDMKPEAVAEKILLHINK